MTPRLARLIAASLLATAVSAAWAAPESDPGDIRFAITRYEVAGNSLLAPAEIEAAVQPYTGAARNFGDVQRALEALESAYHARGYQLVTVQLPEQELNQGVVRLTVVQSVIGQVRVSGNRVFSDANVRAAMPTLQPGRTPDLTAVSANLRMANDNPARRITLRLQGAEKDGEVDANLEVADEKAWKVMLNVDNSGTGPTGATHVGVVLQHANLWGRDHVASLQYTTSAEEPGKVAVWGAGYHVPLYALGDSIDLFASYSNIDTGSVTAGLFDLAVSGKGSVVGLRYNQLLARRAQSDSEGAGARDARVIYGLDIKAYKNSVLYAGQNFGNDITVRPLSVAYLVSAPYDGAELNGSLTLVHNLPGGSRGGSADFARTRSGAKASYTLVRAAGAYARALAQDWQLRLLANGQFSADALVPGEQFGAGGASTVRGLDERALSTDSGLLLNAELYSPQLCGAGARWQCRVLGFVDAAHGSRRHALPDELRSASISSAGLGLRLSYGASMNLQLDYGHVLHTGALTVADKNRLHLRVTLAY